ncbi:MAG TPA: hypothetical protein VHL98_11120 [Microvirga sp.]|jgi:hypothetical protein|nr:hypothetical protein [Microvirga sp.]
MSDALAGKIGRSRADSMGWEYILAIGPIGGSHYLISEIKDDGTSGSFGSKVVSLQRLEPYDFYDNIEIAKGKRPPAR